MVEKIKEWGKIVLEAAVIIVVMFYFCWPARIAGSSMNPGLEDGDIVFTNRVSAMRESYERGDVVLFDYRDEEGEKTLVKRIIAMEGDTLRISPEGVEVNGELLDEPYIAKETTGLVVMTLKKGQVFVMGDNRTESYDSRNMGPIAKESIRAKVYFRLLPPGGVGGNK